MQRLSAFATRITPQTSAGRKVLGYSLGSISLAWTLHHFTSTNHLSTSSASAMSLNASQVQLTTSAPGVCHASGVGDASAYRGSELLQLNHDRFHIFFSESGMHNHIAHHLLTLYALGATPEQLQKAFDDNRGYQRERRRAERKTVENLADESKFREFLGRKEYYDDYVVFFEKEIERLGWQEVVNKYLFGRDQNAEEMMVRMFAGAYHPLIHFGFGVEFRQPAIIAEALSQAAVHEAWVGELLLPAEREAANSSSSASSAGLAQLIADMRADDKIRAATHWTDGNKIRDGLLARAGPDAIALVSRWRVRPEELERRTAEMINAASWFAGAAQRPDKQVKFDFIHMHAVTSSVFFSAFLSQDWMKDEDKVRMLEWKGRLDLAVYASRGCAELRLDEVQNYKASEPGMGWDELVRRVNEREDDGHVSKLIRGIKNGESVCRKFERDDGFPLRGDMWLKMAQMAYDSTNEPKGHKWAVNVGFPQAWDRVPERSKL